MQILVQFTGTYLRVCLGNCDTMGGIRFCGYGFQSEDPLSVLARNPHKGLAREIFHETGRGRGKEGLRDSRQERAVKSRSVKRIEQGREETSQQKSERRLLRPVDIQMPGWPTREDKSALLVACGSFARVHARVNPQKHRMHKSLTDFSLLALGANPSPWLFVLLFFHPLSCVFRVLVKECEILLARDEKNH